MEKPVLVIAVIAIICLLFFGNMKFQKLKEERDTLAAQLVEANNRIVQLERYKTNLTWGALVFIVLNNLGWAYVYHNKKQPQTDPADHI